MKFQSLLLGTLIGTAAAGTFIGTVVDYNGNPIRAAVIQTLKGESLFSDEDGLFLGTIDKKAEPITISAGGYEHSTVIVRDGDSIQVKLNRPSVVKDIRPAVVLVTLLGADGSPVIGQIVSNQGVVETDGLGQASIFPETPLNLILNAEGYRDSVVAVSGKIGEVENLTVKLVPTEEQKLQFATLKGTVRDETGAAIPNTAVSFVNTDYSVVTDKDGRFTLTQIKPGKYSLMAALWGYEATIVNNLTLKTGDSIERMVVLAKQSESRNEVGRVIGKVVDPEGSPMAGIEVRIPEKNRTVTTDNLGRYVIDSVESGVYTLSTWAQGFDTTLVNDVDFWGGETVTSDIILAKSNDGPSILPGNGGLVGVVVSAETGQPISGARVVLKGKRPIDAVTGSDGSFAIQGTPGIYTMAVLGDGFETKTEENTAVILGKNSRYDILLTKSGVSAMSKMTIRGVAIKSSGAALLKERQQTFEVVDAVAAEEFSKAGASSAADAMKQVTGATIVDDKYVIVRGLPAKYSLVTLNESQIASSDPDENAVQMDIFPTGVIDNIRVYKTFQTIRPASFAGGIIDIATKPFPETKKLTFSAGAGYHSLTTGKDFATSENGSRFWLGADDGTRELPQIYKDNSKEEIEKHTIIYGKNLNRPSLSDSITEHLPFVDELAKSLSTEMVSHNKTAAPNYDLSVSYGNSNTSSNGQKFGYNTSFTYKNDRKLKPQSIQRSYIVDDSIHPLRLTKDFLVDDSKERVLWSFLANTAYEPAKGQRVTVDYLYLRSGENKVKNVVGAYPASESPEGIFYASRLHFIERSMNYFKGAGTHQINTRHDHFTIDWNGSFTSSEQDEPDMRDIYSFKDTTRSEDEPDVPVTSWQMMSTMPSPSHSWRNVKSTMGTGTTLVKIPFWQWADDSATVTAGVSWNGSWQEQRNRRIAYKFPSGTATTPAWERINDSVLGILEVDTKVSASGYQWGLMVSDDSRDIAQRDGNTQVFAQFAQLELPLFSTLSTTLGVRGEKATLFDETIVESKRTDSSAATMDNYDVLPSAMLTWKPTDKMVIKSAYGKTIVRPSIREKAEYMTESFTGGGSYIGNRKVERSLIDNIDLRWELFPRAGDILAVGTFYKKIHSPIELKFLDNDQKMPENATSDANILGAELELVRKLDFVPALEGLSFSGNATLVWSRVKLDSASRKQQNYFPEISEDQIDESDRSMFKKITEYHDYRPFQGQSPFVINAFLSYAAKPIGLTSTLYYNVFGKRLGELTDLIEPYLWELPEHMLNASLTKDLGKALKVTFRAKNILNPEKKMVYYKVENNDEDAALEIKEYLKSSVKSGVDFSLGISGTFPVK